MNPAHTLNNDYIVCYRLEKAPGCVKLKLWEPAAQSGRQASDLPYLYAVNFSFSSLHDAEAFLREYLLLNGAFDVPDHNFPAEGEIEILPFPTWGLEE